MGQVITSSYAVATNTWTSPIYRDQHQLLWADVDYTSDGTAGNRQLRLSLKREDGTIVGGWRPDQLQAASNTYYYEFLPGVATASAASPQVDEVDVALPNKLIIPAGYFIQIEDVNNVSASDTMNIDIQTEEY